MARDDNTRGRKRPARGRSEWVELTNGAIALECEVSGVLIQLARMIDDEGPLGELKLAMLRNLASGKIEPDPKNPVAIRLIESHLLDTSGRFFNQDVRNIVDAAVQENPNLPRLLDDIDRNLQRDDPRRSLLKQAANSFIIVSPYANHSDEVHGFARIDRQLERLKSWIQRKPGPGQEHSRSHDR